ncbi:methyl-accepting chemotaxis protein [Bacillus cytotoxicus]|uniref:methyl-accepting chemotaxis protein n=1 Tax=Bacillus cytotoxicus TaxID=580165 RepID=UPI000863F266|nr:methyl-accepting chemotaxis protein [Bacillus cytotoxicus]AWC30410.1 methyl-accepting chemotaxis protein [Bacillus cytotoxicus]AWC42550.1 methyl-accepting chemotaxis protein [Bacillus cytotoxicus]AWC50481.1 methyl-accepting chemotaxis protein [Bacillus cytotoxicus]AWC54536.1 methyl-accepting chemotaxis protein [Bacillus cytotoxicus]AWC58660.1 methyl-accepting chemotaxis protein [Bacillus cytotoxicus]
MKQIGIRKKLLFMFLGICSLFSIALIIILSYAISETHKAETLKSEVSKRATILKERGDWFQAQVAGLQEYLLSHDQKGLDKFNREGKKLADTRKEVTSDKKLSEGMKEAILMGGKWRSVIDNEVLPLAREGKWEEASKIAIEQTDYVNDLLDRFTKYANEEKEKQNQLIEDIHTSSEFIQYIIFFSLIACTIISILLAWWFSGHLVKPIQKIDSKLKELASKDGDLTARLDVNSRDEIGNIAHSFNQMLANLQHIIQQVQQTSTNVKEASLSMYSSTIASMDATSQIQDTMVSLDDSIRSQVSSIEESSTAMDDMSKSVQRIANSASSVAELAMTTAEKADDGGKVIEKSISQMNTIHEAVNATSQVVERLITHTKHIDTAVQSISNIAEQTNLLALNASIEAARAGEQGKGFAVVADEVRKLAEQSKTAATDINHLLRQIQNDTQAANDMMTQGQSEASQGITVIRTAGSSFTAIVNHINEVSTQMQEMSATAEEMAASAEEMNASLNNIASISNEVAADTTQTSNSAGEQVHVMKEVATKSSEMKATVEELEALVAHFKTIS